MTGHNTPIQDLAFAPDGRFLASVGGAYHGHVPAEVKVWDWLIGSEVADYPGHTGLVTGVAFFPDGRRLATSSDDRTIKLWDVQNREDVLTLRGHTSGVTCLAISADGRQIASGSIDNTARIWSIETHEGPTAFALALRRAAVERVQALFVKHLLKTEVLDALRANRFLSPQLRAAALEVAEHRGEDAAALFEAGWLTVIRPLGRPEENELALRRLEAACRVVAGDPDRLAEYRRALALANYRAGKPEQALQIVQGLAAASAASDRTPLELAVLAMANQKLGRTHEAQAALDQLRLLLKTDRWANDPEARNLLREAEGVVGPPQS
jgi:hypothetical protein